MAFSARLLFCAFNRAGRRRASPHEACKTSYIMTFHLSARDSSLVSHLLLCCSTPTTPTVQTHSHWNHILYPMLLTLSYIYFSLSLRLSLPLCLSILSFLTHPHICLSVYLFHPPSLHTHTTHPHTHTHTHTQWVPPRVPTAVLARQCCPAGHSWGNLRQSRGEMAGNTQV